MKTKRFDCVEMKRRGSLEIYKRTKGMTLKQELAYWKKQSDALRKELATKKSRPKAAG